jgi:hypothetical protein
VTYRHTWGEHRVFFHDQDGRLRSLPATWTSVAPPEPFVEASAGRSLFRVDDLLALAALVSRLSGRSQIDGASLERESEAGSVR